MAEFVAGRGTTALGIIGTVLGSLGVAGNNGMGLFNNNGNCGCSENTPVNRYELNQEQTIAKLQSAVALRDSNIYGDQKSIELYKYIDGELKSIRTEMFALDKAVAVKNAQIEGAFGVLGEKIAAQRNEFICALNRERDERCCGDNSIITYLNATFYPKQVADVTVGTTNTAQPTYNPLPNCGCGCK